MSEDYGNDQRSEFPHTPSRLTGICLLAALLTFIAALSLMIILPLRANTVKFEGHTRYSEETIRKACGTDLQGAVIPFINEDKLEENLRNALPYVNSISLSFQFPCTLIVSVTDSANVYYATASDGTIYYLNSDLKVLEIPDAPTEEQLSVKTQLLLPSFSMGEENSILSITENDDYITNFLKMLEKSNSLGDIARIDLRDKYNTTVYTDSRFFFRMGDTSELEIKLKLAAGLRNKCGETADAEQAFLISVVNPAGPYYRPNVDLNELLSLESTFTPRYYTISASGAVCFLTPTLRVTDVFPSLETADTTDLSRLYLPVYAEGVANSKLNFGDTDAGYMTTVLEQLGQVKITGSLQISFTDQKNIRLLVDGVYLIRLGDASEMAKKLAYAESALTECRVLFDGSSAFSIDITNPSAGASYFYAEEVTLD